MLYSDVRHQNKEHEDSKVEHEERAKIMRKQLQDGARDGLKLKNN